MKIIPIIKGETHTQALLEYNVREVADAARKLSDALNAAIDEGRADLEVSPLMSLGMLALALMGLRGEFGMSPEWVAKVCQEQLEWINRQPLVVEMDATRADMERRGTH